MTLFDEVNIGTGKTEFSVNHYSWADAERFMNQMRGDGWLLRECRIIPAESSGLPYVYCIWWRGDFGSNGVPLGFQVI